MKYLDFEKHIKKEFENSKETVQMDALLASLDLGKEPKRKGFAFWMILPFLILIFSALAWKFMDSYNYKVDESSSVEGVSSSSSSSSSSSEGKEVYDNIGSAIVQNENTKYAHIDYNNDINADSSNEELATASNTIKTTEISAKNKKDNSNNTSGSNRPPANNNELINKPQNSFSPQSHQPIQKSDLNSAKTQSNESSAPLNSGYLGNPSAAISKDLTRDLLSISRLGESKSIDFLGNNEIDGDFFSRMKINCPSFENPSWHMALIPEIGIFMPKKTLAQNGFEESAAFAERLESESTLEGIQLGLYGMLVRDNIPFYLKAGLSYSRISERMELEYETTRLDTTQGLIAVTVSGNGDTLTYVKGDIISEIKSKGSNRQHHYIHLFDIPISLGYTAYIAGLDVGIEGGVKVNFMTRATGNLLTSPTEYTNLSLNRLFKNRIGLSYFGGLMIGRNFGQYGDIYIAPRVNYYPDEFNNQNNSVSQKYFTVGINAGVVYKIN